MVCVDLSSSLGDTRKTVSAPDFTIAIERVSGVFMSALISLIPALIHDEGDNGDDDNCDDNDDDD
jgi:hypothetical protein